MSGKTISSLSVGLFGDVSHFAHAFGHTATESARKFGESTKEAGNKLLELTGIGAAIGGVFEGVMEIGKGFRLASEFQQSTVALGAMIGSGEQAEGVLKQLREYAKASPFEFKDLAGSARNLAAFGTSADQIVPTLKMLGDIAAGTGGSVDELAQLYIRVKEQGTIAGRELREFTTAGVPLTAALAKSLGKSPEQIHQLGEAGKITFPMIQRAFIQMTQSGGAFADMTKKQAQTMGGLWTTLTHTVDDNLEKIADSFAKGFNLSGTTDHLTAFVDRIGDLMSKVAYAVGLGLNAIAGAAEMLWDALDKVLSKIGVFGNTLEWIKAEAKSLGLDQIPAPKIDPLKPMTLEVTPHMNKTPIVRWGSAEMQRLSQEWAGQFPHLKPQKPQPAPATPAGTSPLTKTQIDAMKLGFLAEKAGTFKDSVNQFMQKHFHPTLQDKRIKSLLESTTNDPLHENSWVDSHGVRHQQKDTPWHTQDWHAATATMGPRTIYDPDKLKPGSEELKKAREEAKQDMYRNNDYLYKIWQQGQNAAVATF